MSDQKEIFISYSWDSDEHKEWVKKFSDDLQARLGEGFKVLLDQNLTKGASYSRFMKRGLKEANKVLIIGTPKYKGKTEESGGVGYEATVITNEMMSDMDTTKFYPILRSGTFETSFPTDIKDKRGDDFRDDSKYEENLQIVVDSLLQGQTPQVPLPPKNNDHPTNFPKTNVKPKNNVIDKRRSIIFLFTTLKNWISENTQLLSLLVTVIATLLGFFTYVGFNPFRTVQNPHDKLSPNQPISSKNNNQTTESLVFSVGDVSFKMIRVEGGTFQMGAKEDDSEADDNEKPAHQVELPTFYIGETEVSYALWDAVHEKGTLKDDISSHKDMQNQPVENVSWNQCKLFIEMLNAVTGRIFRLPTEAEWEFAARGGQKSESFKYSGSNKVDDVAWYEKNSYGETHDVARRKANELGLYDMSGNVWEWCYDPYEKYSGSPQKDPQISGNDNFRVFRGGGYYGGTSDCRVTSRKVLPSGERLSGIGFRLALSE